ncbi:hypothetical protein MES5069_220154 [Mesorhizobium escarrei]|uniref:Uncharacterized protein n=1 Tax=Mesorhizobium escarrei TaxID=666018 RepID=A0ABN8JMR9_9HYPH|nr:hypothetical protein MES5069_220154 [Mesorhizobium escarrei]
MFQLFCVRCNDPEAGVVGTLAVKIKCIFGATAFGWRAYCANTWEARWDIRSKTDRIESDP